MDDEPDVPRLWLPDQDAPGLAMARAFGDFCLKNHGLICTPEVYYRKLSEKDDFLVLATDGVTRVDFFPDFPSSFMSISTFQSRSNFLQLRTVSAGTIATEIKIT
ncbi:unnamed protein product [Triticum turgidum subsp. durum]|uniref:protein-serine/threonine phosphatase n=1 Tax=Triticum turgidum subsp. durum TaxID=4567 RepID=A0A9R0TNI0_TRITD|nr:unnamed protein product [Triticum turgidum subsp. durum]